MHPLPKKIKFILISPYIPINWDVRERVWVKIAMYSLGRLIESRFIALQKIGMVSHWLLYGNPSISLMYTGSLVSSHGSPDFVPATRWLIWSLRSTGFSVDVAAGETGMTPPRVGTPAPKAIGIDEISTGLNKLGFSV
jgi:hypothetical protein